jgi:hypothetical protein
MKKKGNRIKALKLFLFGAIKSKINIYCQHAYLYVSNQY